MRHAQRTEYFYLTEAVEGLFRDAFEGHAK